jgi:hypothetical protein
MRITYAGGSHEDRWLPPGSYMIGRDTGNIILGDPGVSATHAQLDVSAHGVQIVDAGSNNGVLDASGARISGWYRMSHQQPVRLGSSSLALLQQMPAAGGTQAVPQMSYPPPQQLAYAPMAVLSAPSYSQHQYGHSPPPAAPAGSSCSHCGTFVPARVSVCSACNAERGYSRMVGTVLGKGATIAFGVVLPIPMAIFFFATNSFLGWIGALCLLSVAWHSFRVWSGPVWYSRRTLDRAEMDRALERARTRDRMYR